MYNRHIMAKQAEEEKPTALTENNPVPEKMYKKSTKAAYILGGVGIIITVLMAVAIVVFKEEVQALEQYGYMGAFFISILGGATIIIPVPMLAIVFALGGVMPSPWLVAISAALGETVGALTIYMTGHSAGRVISGSKLGRFQKAYERMLRLIERRGTITLLAVTSVINPFFYPAAFACGALKYGLGKYTVIVFIGKTIKCMTVVYAGYFGLKGIFRLIGVDV
jgi:membrane protein YqaA with SNARE-associated domain